ncbi:MAG: DUF349 domain-containing protein [Actinomycetota bacterium]|nr:DUF349 domain-containing protein [Actinomycetota bacterium]
MADPIGPTPMPTPMPTPAMLRPAQVAAAPSPFGRVDADGTVYLQAPEGEIRIGQWAAGPSAAGLAFFQRKYEDLVVEIDLIGARLADGRATPAQAQGVLAKVQEALAARAFVGDVAALDGKCDSVAASIAQVLAAAAEKRAAVRAEATAARDALTAEAEQLGPSTAWKQSSERFAAIVEEWKALPRTDRATEQLLWKRISTARTGFDKRRRQHFTEADALHKVAVARKRELIAAAEALAKSTDWVSTGKKIRDLMNDWKTAPRGGRSDEDKLWKRFKAAQDEFFAAKTTAEQQAEAALLPNLAEKELLVSQAEALLPITDHKAAKTALRGIHERWEKIGDLPRGERERLEGRLRKVDEALRKGESETWKKSNPEARARAESTANVFADGIAKLEVKRQKAETSGNLREVAKLDTAIEQTTALLRAAQAAANEFGSLTHAG